MLVYEVDGTLSNLTLVKGRQDMSASSVGLVLVGLATVGAANYLGKYHQKLVSISIIS